MAAVDEGTVASRGEPGSTFYSSVSERNLHYPLLVVELFSSPAIVLSRICCLVQGYGNPRSAHLDTIVDAPCIHLTG